MAFDPLAGDVLRPDSWDQFIGQEALKVRLQKHIDAAIQDMRPPSHTLLIAPPGAGKTTIARLIARRMGVDLETLVMPVEFKAITQLLVNDQFSGVLFLDEIHRLSTKEQEDYLTLIETNYIQFRGEKFMVGWLMIVAATTEKKKVIKTLRDRFPFKPALDPYTDSEVTRILRGMTERLGFEIPEKEAEVLAKACLGTPRRARDFAFAARDLRVLADGKVPDAEEVLDHLRIDRDGLGVEHWDYLRTMQKLGGKAGLKPMCSMLGESEAVIEEIEKVLIGLDLLKYGEQGRELRTAAFQKLRQDKEERTEVAT
jgi:Holliday junction DNA helicase RuvB